MPVWKMIFKRKGSLPRDLVQSCLGISTSDTPLYYSRLLISVQAGDPRGGKRKGNATLYDRSEVRVTGASWDCVPSVSSCSFSEVKHHIQ